MKRWPTAFPAHPEAIRPLAVGIHQLLEKEFPDRSPEQIRRAIAQWRYPRLGAYLRAVARGGARYDLDGQPCGEVTEGEKDNARQRLHEWRAKRKAQAAAAAAAAAVSSPDGSLPDLTPLPLPDAPGGDF
jgi:ProP effector